MDIPFFVYLIAGAVVFWIIRVLYLYSEQASSVSFAQRFKQLGNVIGRTPSDIIAHVGRPTSVHRIGTEEIYTWTKTAYEIALIFEAGVCRGIQHEYSRDLSQDA